MKIKMVLDAFKYYTRGQHLIAVALGAVGFSFWQWSQTFFSLVPAAAKYLELPCKLIGGFTGFAVLVIMPGIIIRAILNLSVNSAAPIDWRSIADLQKNVLEPAIRVVMVILWSFLPVEMYLALLVKRQASPSPVLLIFLLAFSLFYFPMALLVSVRTEKIMPSLLPSKVLEPIFRTFKNYLRLLIVYWPVTILPLPAFLIWPVPFIGPLMASFIILYFWLCGIYLMGIFYSQEKGKLE